MKEVYVFGLHWRSHSVAPFLCMGFSLYGHLMPGDIHRKELKKELKLFEFLFEFVK